MAIDPQELELRTTFFKERLILQDKHQAEIKAQQLDQQARFKALLDSRAKTPPTP
jgi:hypothetical protein